MTTETGARTAVVPQLQAIAATATVAARELARLTTDVKNAALAAMAEALRADRSPILAANADDVTRARAAGADEAMIDRLTVTAKVLDGFVAGIEAVIRLPDPIGTMEDSRRLPNGMEVGRRRVPLGVVAAIFESRPNVTVDISALCLKSGNAVILRGGSEALASNRTIAQKLRAAAESAGAPAGCIQIVTDPDRDLVRQLLQMRDAIDVVIPRGGPGLIEFVIETATVPVIETGWGVCHTYVDAGADLDSAERIVVNAKTRRPSICNALDTLLVHRDIAAEFVARAVGALTAKGVEVHAHPSAREFAPSGAGIVPLAADDLDTEWLALRMSLVVVDGLEDALDHIRAHGSGHSEAIVTESQANARRFLQDVDAAAVYVNASTQFTDGGEFGLGAEVGISTQKLHARGPMGLREMTTYKWIVLGDGHVRPV